MNREFAEKYLKAIGYEREQDVAQTARLLSTLSLPQLVKNGLAISNLNLENIRTGLSGDLFMELAPNHAVNDEIQKSDIKVGDIVVVRAKPASSTKSKKLTRAKKHTSKVQESPDSGTEEDASCIGVVYKMTTQQVVLTINEHQEIQATNLLHASKPLYVTKTTNTITYKRMESTMRKLAEFEETPSNRIVQLLLNMTTFIPNKPLTGIKYFNDQLNKSQQDAIAFSMENELSIIHGPPGTGKTYTLVELILQLVLNKNQRVLVCGPSNISVDTILERLSAHLPGNLLLRIGHPARLLKSNLLHSLDILTKRGDNGALLNDIYKDIDKTIAGVRKLKSYKDRREAWNEVKTLRKELRARERSIVTDLILEAKVVVATLHGASSKELLKAYDEVPKLFDTVIIDEVSQSLEPQCWIPLISHYKSNISKLVLAGDDKQLPPTVKTEDNAKFQKQLETTLFDRLVKNYGNVFKKFLDVQYRMNETIMEFPSKAMYNGKLLAHDSVATKLLLDLPGCDTAEDTEVAVIWYDTQGDFFLESEDSDSAVFASKYNENEALVVKSHILKLIGDHVSPECIGIISPYSAQVTLIKGMIREMYPSIEISTVDGFQGREKEVIILSLVRSNDKFEVGFLQENRRLNVAMTRPKKQLCVVGNIEMLERCGNKYLRSWGEWAEQNADLRYPDIDDFSE
ncbi:ATP-dependent 5'-3' DNA helicase HCS1 KNAG_0H00230 [Huiozyma naganishii CBS 8797]|uniref:DNA helicase n=1 Tax=Huiozyma naganishii (strain ATCC MYA-139 / BCRC 22969 / CBS 8797 / KCTC 17520 / NBRC 10181 / NCYC 3082 / Yp74L-3) TaxID=1071383 RepID=J7S8A0_HUIN7|nr:hypothetical protein KNAG_0H00230 [Kazachstania naganishii CBS 8797]CCK71439.1 hypothetical protein KNAG_0H00230 [Kazachstania naganishii CBS 8797]